MITINTKPSSRRLLRRSKWWGLPEEPMEEDRFDGVPIEGMTWDNGQQYNYPLTLVCQIRCSDIAQLDAEGVLPHTGMLWFYAALDYYRGERKWIIRPGIGEWDRQYYKVYYSPTCKGLTEVIRINKKGKKFIGVDIPAETIHFSNSGTDFSACLLGCPFPNKVSELSEGMIPLLQLKSDNRWGLRLPGNGVLTFMISPEDLAARRFSEARVFVYPLRK